MCQLFLQYCFGKIIVFKSHYQTNEKVNIFLVYTLQGYFAIVLFI